MSMAMHQVVTQIQQELFTMRLQVAAQSTISRQLKFGKRLRVSLT